MDDPDCEVFMSSLLLTFTAQSFIGEMEALRARAKVGPESRVEPLPFAAAALTVISGNEQEVGGYRSLSSYESAWAWSCLRTAVTAVVGGVIGAGDPRTAGHRDADPQRQRQCPDATHVPCRARGLGPPTTWPPCRAIGPAVPPHGPPVPPSPPETLRWPPAARRLWDLIHTDARLSK